MCPGSGSGGKAQVDWWSNLWEGVTLSESSTRKGQRLIPDLVEEAHTPRDPDSNQVQQEKMRHEYTEVKRRKKITGLVRSP